MIALDPNPVNMYFVVFCAAFVGNSLAATVIAIPPSHTKSIKSTYDAFSEHFLLPQDFDLAEKTPVKKPNAEELDAMQNVDLFEGDIVGIPLDEGPPLLMRDVPIDYNYVFYRPYHSSLNLQTYPDKLWTDARVPYMMEEGMTESQRAAIAQAFDEYKEKTCIRFVPRQESDFDYIYIKRNVAFGCSSYVGRAGGNQTVSLEIGKCFTKGIIAHELMHALGFFHEHSRTDRDQFVTIDEDNIRPGMMRNFEKYPRKIIDPLGMPYDYESVMHYHKLAFSRNGKSTIIPKKKGAEIGQRYKLSAVDAEKISRLYKCADKKATTAVPSTTTATTTTPYPTTVPRGTSSRWTERPSTKTPSTTEEQTEAPTTTSTKKPEEKCENLNAHCDMWEQLGHCQHSSKYMSHYCRKACGFCFTEPENKPITPTGKKCKDKNLFCGYWAKIGECRSESKFMKIFCRNSCGHC
ncbi:hypothetical protein L596_004301 [Steinernema carpocapsae]|uniref:Metalloendopeptidase n=1 Tax=Steinernema carpocapsae TaxID=34508 RepID=A0A4U8UVD9_STECR|nr:hypothetical protein L596_004301 [Steinernema carpocapsae]